MNKLPVKPTIIVDTREQHPLFDEDPAGDADVAAYVREKIDAGDYTIKEIPNLVVIEKKQDGKELYNNLIVNKERWLRQVERMRSFRHKYIVIQQSYSDFLDAKKWAPIQPYNRRFSMIAIVEAWLISLLQKDDIHFIFAGDDSPRITKRILVKSYEWERKRLKRIEKNDQQPKD